MVPIALLLGVRSKKWEETGLGGATAFSVKLQRWHLNGGRVLLENVDDYA